MKCKNTIFFIFILCLCILYTAPAQTPEIERVRITQRRVYIYLSQPASGFRSLLSQDKKKITLFLKNTGIAESAKETRGQGAIENVYIQRGEKEAEISILLKEKLGYTAAHLPFSKAITVEVFDWNEVSGPEDHYRSGLLALESNNTTALSYFLKAAAGGHADAAAYAGIIFLKQNKAQEAKDNLLKAVEANTGIADAYAALAQIYSSDNDPVKADHMREIFRQRTALGNGLADSAHSAPASDSFIDSMHVSSDSAMMQEPAKADAGKDTAITSQKPLVFKDQSEPTPASWTTKLFLSGVVIIAGLAAITGWLYLRWKRQFKSSPPATAGRPAATSSSENQPGSFAGALSYAAKAYAQTDNSTDDSTADSEPGRPSENISEELKPFKNNKSSKHGESTPEHEPKKADYQESWLEILKEEKPVSNTQAEETAQYSAPGNVELANVLREKHIQQKAETLSTLHSAEIPNDPAKLSQQAKKLGVEQATLETKKKLSELESDEERLEQLRRKFS